LPYYPLQIWQRLGAGEFQEIAASPAAPRNDKMEGPIPCVSIEIIVRISSQEISNGKPEGAISAGN